MKTIIHVNQHHIRWNGKNPSQLKPVLTAKTHKSNEYGFTCTIKDDAGNTVGVFKYRPEKPLSCGAKVWFETDFNVEVD